MFLIIYCVSSSESLDTSFLKLPKSQSITPFSPAGLPKNFTKGTVSLDLFMIFCSKENPLGTAQLQRRNKCVEIVKSKKN